MLDKIKKWWTDSLAQPSVLEKIADATRKADDLAATYGVLLEHRPVCPGEVADVSELPGDKEAIKDAIIARCLTVRDQDTRSAIKVAFCLLSYWQPGVGPERIGVNVSDFIAAMVSLKTDNESAQYRELAQKIKDGKKWDAIKKAEYNALRDEFDRRVPGVV